MYILRVAKSEIYAWAETLLRYVPGRIGIVLRCCWYKKHFKSCNEVLIGIDCTFISPQSISLNGFASIGDHSFFTADGGSIVVGGESSFNSNVHINASLGGMIKIGKMCLVGPNVVMRTAGHRFDDPSLPIRHQGHIINDITIEDNVWIGSNAIVLGGVRIGSGSVIGAGAVVVSDIPDMAVAVGIPAKVIKFRRH